MRINYISSMAVSAAILALALISYSVFRAETTCSEKVGKEALSKDDVRTIAHYIFRHSNCKNQVTMNSDKEFVLAGENSPGPSWDHYQVGFIFQKLIIISELIDIGHGGPWPGGPSDGRINDWDIILIRFFSRDFEGNQINISIMDEGADGIYWGVERKLYEETLRLILFIIKTEKRGWGDEKTDGNIINHYFYDNQFLWQRPCC